MSDIKNTIICQFKNIYNKAMDIHERKIISEALFSEAFGKVVVNKRPQKIKKVGIILFSIDKYEGGVTSVLRLGTGLSKLGYDVSYVVYGNQKINDLIDNATFNLKDFKGTVKKSQDVTNNSFDVIVATSWRSVYKLNYYNAYKMYFVQDYEPYFFKLNERYLLARQTYNCGYHIVSLGQWNINQIKRECPTTLSKLDYIDFPYERKEYNNSFDRDYISYHDKKVFKIAVYIKEDGKRIPNIIQFILKLGTEELSKRYGITLVVNYFGLNKRYKTLSGNNLGKLNKSELMNLYQSSDFGLVASMTNISLVPFEMLATGLPIFEFSEGSFFSFFSNDCAAILDYNYENFVQEFLKLIEEPIKIQNMISNATANLNRLSWEQSCKQFADCMEGI